MNPSFPLRILLAEDEPSVALAISFALKADGHKTEIATDGEQALAKLTAASGAFDLLITDNNMPRLTGMELVRRLRETPFSGKILVLSAHLSPENRTAYDALRVDGMIPKPFDLHHLRAVVNQIARGEVPFTAADPNPFQLSPTDVHRMLKLGLLQSEKPAESA